MQKVKFYHLSTLSRVNIISLFLIIFLFSSCRVQSQIPSYPIKMVNGVECIVYTVQASEGFYRIGKNLNTTEAIIREYNPQVKDGLKVGMELYIPTGKTESTQSIQNQHTTQSTAPTSTNYKEHIVEKKQTIFSIRKMYDITEEQLLNANPHLRERVLQAGEVLRIPIANKETVKVPEPAREQEVREVKEVVERPELLRDQEVKGDVSAKTYKIAYLLPFMLDQKQETSDKRFLEFYAGSLLAIKQLKESNINFDIYAFDVAKTEMKLMSLINSGDLDGMDLIIGPAYSNQVSIICDFARMQKIKTLIPFSSKIYNIESNEYIFQFNPGQDLEIEKIESILKKEEGNSHIVFADLTNVNPSDEGYLRSISLKHYLDDLQRPYKSIELHPDSMHLIQQALNPLADNIVFFNTSRINHISLYLMELNRLSSRINLKFYEPYSWRSTNIEKPRSCYISAFKSDYANDAFDTYTQDFYTTYQWTASSEAPRYDLLGYDLTQYFVKNILNNKAILPNEYPYYEGLQSDLRFKKTSLLGGYINTVLNHFE